MTQKVQKTGIPDKLVAFRLAVHRVGHAQKQGAFLLAVVQLHQRVVEGRRRVHVLDGFPAVNHLLLLPERGDHVLFLRNGQQTLRGVVDEFLVLLQIELEKADQERNATTQPLASLSRAAVVKDLDEARDVRAEDALGGEEERGVGFAALGEQDVGAVVEEREDREGGDERVVLQHGEGVVADGEVEGVEWDRVQKGGGERQGGLFGLGMMRAG